MTEDRFWALIEQHVTGRPELDVDVSGLRGALEELPAGEIVSFDEIFCRLHRASYSWRLWGAAYLINGGCSDDGFDYFRAWLIAQGRTVFEKALADPDSLVEHSAEGVECEEMLGAAWDAYQSVTGGKDLPCVPYDHPRLGERWAFDDRAEMKKRYPRLFERYAGA